LDLCAITDTLIADADGAYHPADFNDRLVLELKGTMSEAELYLIKSRLTAGLKHKAAKRELRQGLPVGLDYDEVDRGWITPDEAVREAIATVFRRFEKFASARQVLIRLHEDGVSLPRAAHRLPSGDLGTGDLPGGTRRPDQPGLRGAFRVRPDPH
jgi:DNA invertase Pin-like site-specific DNA recombinase